MNYKKFTSSLGRLFRNDLNQFVEEVDTDIKSQKQRVDDLIKGTPQPSEVVDARGGMPLLRDRLDKVDAEMAQTAPKKLVGKSSDDYRDLAVGVGTPEEDWTLAIQTLLDTDRLHKLPTGRYRITDELVIRNRSSLEGAGNSWSANAEKDSVIYYDGVADQNKAVIRASTSVVGVDPSNALTNIVLRNIVLDANGKAGYGLYSAYVSDDSDIQNITAINATQHGIRIEKGWYASYRNLVAKNNFGCGITIGKGFEGWASTSKQVNSCYMDNLRGHNNGLDLAFNKDTNKEWGYGVGLYNGYNLKLRGVTVEKNDGAGLVFNGSLPDCGVDGLYCEGNDERGTDDKALAVIYVGNSLGRGHFLRDVYLWGEHAHTRPQSIWLTGSKPSSPLEIKNVNFGKLKADWDAYTLKEAYYGMTDYIEGNLPQNEIIGDYALTTLYVRNGGNDNNNGRTPSSAFATLSKAISMAKFAERVTTIDCTGATITETTLDFSEVKKEITITGGTTAKTTNSTNNKGIEIINARQGIVFKEFASISRILPTRSFVKVQSSSVILTDNGAFGVVYSIDSEVRLTSCSLDKNTSTNPTMTGITAINSKITMEGTTFGTFTVGRYIQLRDGSSILCDSWLSAFEDGYLTIDDAGYVMGGNKLKNRAGVLTFA